MKNNLLVLILSLSCFSALAQGDKLFLKKIYSTGKQYDVENPILVDSTNLKGDRFDNKNLLETFITIPDESDFTNEIKADISNYFFVNKARSGARFYLLFFQIEVDRYVKTNVRISAPSMFEAYINGVKESSKTSIEDTLSTAKTLKLNFPAQPGVYTILIKYMSLATNVAQEGIKITVESEEKDSKAKYTFLGKEKHPITIKELLTGKRVTSSTISPNGDYVLLNYSTTKDDGKTFGEKELLSLKTNRRIVLASATDYSWLPTSNKLYYAENKSGVTNLFVVDPETLQEQILAQDIPSGNFRFTPDEKRLIYTDKEVAEPNKSDLILLTTPESRQENNDDRYFLSKYDFSTGVKQRLTYGQNSTNLNDISADSRYILYSVSEYIPTKRPFYFTSMYRLDLTTLAIDTLWENQGFASSAIFSPNGNQILIEGSGEAFDGIGLDIQKDQIANSYNTLAFVMDLATKDVEPITRYFKPSINSSSWNALDGNIYFRVTDKDFERVYVYEPNKKTFELLPLSEDVIRSFDLSDKSLIASYYGVGASNTTRAYTFDLKTKKSNLIADPYVKTLETLDLSKVEDWSFTASDGTTIDGRYYLPPNFDTTKKYPMIVYYYGGTMPTARTLEGSYPPQVYAALGYVVYVLQPSGAIGYGQEFAARHVNGWGKRNADDIIEGTQQFAKEHSFVNDKKIGCIGASYGGYMTMYLQTQTDIFAAAVSHAGISSIASYWGEGYWGYTYSSGASANSYPWNNKELYVEQSPLFNAEKVKTPLLLLHGTIDTNVPIGESIQMYTALKILGKPVEFIQVKGENHGIRDFKKRLEWNYSIYAWFSKWLQDDSSWWDSMYPQK